MEKLKDWLGLVVIYGLIYTSWGAELIKKVYYVVFFIPHYKVDDKFHPIYKRDKT